ncbi:hypothetical protein ACIQNU_11520 [Streptomyces sp. NPDC091292]|uniref:hypothetical protein n=1 Tax=Streptomyces sp. NPDC091292 TaxID=3365991 RepID=UPI0038206639
MSPDRTGGKEKRKAPEPRERYGERRADGPIPRRKEQAKPGWEREREKLEQNPDAAAKRRERQRDKMRELRKNRKDGTAEPPQQRGQRGQREQRQDSAQRQDRGAAPADVPSLIPEIAALEVYETYRERMAGWPDMPPVGLRVALHPESAGQGQDAVVVRLNTPQSAHGPSGSAVPPFLADPSLDMMDRAVQMKALAAGVVVNDYGTAMGMHYNLRAAFRAEEFGADDASLSQGGQIGSAYGAQQQAPMFDGVDMDALLAESSREYVDFGGYAAPDNYAASGNYTAFDTAGLAAAPVNSAAPYLSGTDSLSAGMQGLTVAPYGAGVGAGAYLPEQSAAGRATGSYRHQGQPTAYPATSATQQPWGQAPQGNTRQGPAR